MHRLTFFRKELLVKYLDAQGLLSSIDYCQPFRASPFWATAFSAFFLLLDSKPDTSAPSSRLRNACCYVAAGIHSELS